MTRTKKTALMVVDGGHLRALLEHNAKKTNAYAPRVTANNIDRILRGCVADDEDLQRIYYYDCSDFTGRFRAPYPSRKHGECIALYESDLAKRIKRGSKFHILDPLKIGGRLSHTEKASTAVWVARQDTARVFEELAQNDLFVVRHGKMMFKEWKESKRHEGPKYFPDVQQKGVDMLIGLDIATIAITGQAQRIIFVANDTDFVPALKFARRAGRKVQVVIIDLPGGRKTAHALRMNSDFYRKVAWPKGLETDTRKSQTTRASTSNKRRGKRA